MKKKQKQVFVFDIDGTLLGPRSKKFNKAAIKTLNVAGKYGEIVLASARPLEGIKTLYDPNELRVDHVVALNGGLIIKAGGLFEYSELDKEVVEYLLARKSFFKNVWIFTQENWYASNLGSKVYRNEQKSVSLLALPWTQYNGAPVLKVTIVLDDEIAQLLKDVRVLSRNAQIAQSCGLYVEMNSKGADKYKAIQRLYREQNIRLFSFGDADNDLPLLRNSFYSCVVANASFQARSAADYISNLKYAEGSLDCIQHIASNWKQLSTS